MPSDDIALTSFNVEGAVIHEEKADVGLERRLVGQIVVSGVECFCHALQSDEHPQHILVVVVARANVAPDGAEDRDQVPGLPIKILRCLVFLTPINFYIHLKF